MIVVADTSPLNYLAQIGHEDFLPRLYGRIVVPPAVMQELNSLGAPEAVRAWMLRIPAWIDVRPIASLPNTELAYLDPGEQEAIQLAQEQHADLLLIDERKGRLEAKRRGLMTTGTLGVLLSAGAVKLIDPKVAYYRLIAETTFRTSAALEAQFLGKISG